MAATVSRPRDQTFLDRDEARPADPGLLVRHEMRGIDSFCDGILRVRNSSGDH